MVVRPIGKSDLREAGAILSDSFWTYPEVVHLLPAESRRRRLLPRYLTADCVDALRFRTLMGAYHEGTLVGVSAWLPPGAYPPSTGRQIAAIAHLLPIVPWALTIAPEVLRSQAAKDAGHTHDPHVYLCEIGVSRTAQGTGAGSALVHAMTRAADEAAVGCYLTTSNEANTAWYGRFGFEITEEFRPTATWPRVWRMWRTAKETTG
jgi:GNAT superfamily N-acetyltransferase